MNYSINPRGVLQIDGARIVFRNFAGAPSQFNREGDRNFAIVIPNQEMADELIAEGWNIKIRPPREDGDDPFMYLPVKIKINDRGPKFYLVSNGVQNELIPSDDPEEDMVAILDNIDIMNVDLDVRPYDWEVLGKTGRTAYLQSICVTQEVNRFARPRFENGEDMPF
jgi:hypothetical protein